MTVKPGATVGKMTPDMKAGAEAVEECYAAFGADCTVTSGDEPETIHRGRPVDGGVVNPHYEGRALDFRLWNVPPESRGALVKQITDRLGAGWVTLWEIGGHILQFRGGEAWSLVCAWSSNSSVVIEPLPDTCPHCQKTVQGPTPHLHVQHGRPRPDSS